MNRSIGALITSLCLVLPGFGHAQSMIMGYSGSGITTDLRRVIEKEKLW